MKGISLKGGMPFGFGGVYEKNSLYAILWGAEMVFRLRLRVVERKRYVTRNLFKFSYIFVSNYVSWNQKRYTTNNLFKFSYIFASNYVLWNENATPQVIYSNFRIFSFPITCRGTKTLQLQVIYSNFRIFFVSNYVSERKTLHHK